MKNTTLKAMLFTAFVIGSTLTTLAQRWPQVGSGFGTTPTPRSTYFSPEIAYNPSTDELYTAFVNPNANGNELVVLKTVIVQGRRHPITQWQMVGTTQYPIDFTELSLAVQTATNKPYVAFVNEKTHKYIVHRFDGVSWQDVGTIPEYATMNCPPTIIFSPQNELYIAFIESTNSNNVTVKKFDGTLWNTAGKTIGNATNVQPGFPGGYFTQHSCSLAFNPSTALLYIAYVDASNMLSLKFFSANGVWESAGADISVNQQLTKAAAISSHALAFNPKTNMAYVSFVNNLGFTKVVNQRYTKSRPGLGTVIPSILYLANVLSDSIKIGGVTTLAFNPLTGEPYLAGWEAGGGVFEVQKYTGTTWQFLGYNDCSGLNNHPPSIGPSCGYNNSYQTPNITFNTNTNKAYLAYANELGPWYEVRREP